MNSGTQKSSTVVGLFKSHSRAEQGREGATEGWF
jgi:hypothetical protein